MTDAKLRKDNRELAIARAEEAAKYRGLNVVHEQNGPWITFYGYTLAPVEEYIVIEVQERGWKAASDAFVAAVNEWAQKKGAE